MTFTCTSCAKPFSFDEARFGDRASVKVRCPACKTVNPLERPAPAPPPDAPKSAAATQAEGSGSPTQKLKRDEVIAAADGGEILLPMPANKRISLALLGGKMAGQVVACERSRVVIGRSGADVNVEDDEVSRRHAVLEIRDDRFFLKDLGSTNGTFVDERKISEQEIYDKGEFRVGGTQIMLIVTPRDEV
jgi:phage FluMu protein Com